MNKVKKRVTLAYGASSEAASTWRKPPCLPCLCLTLHVLEAALVSTSAPLSVWKVTPLLHWVF